MPWTACGKAGRKRLARSSELPVVPAQPETLTTLFFDAEFWFWRR
jgi:hypothetical protein